MKHRNLIISILTLALLLMAACAPDTTPIEEVLPDNPLEDLAPDTDETESEVEVDTVEADTADEVADETGTSDTPAGETTESDTPLPTEPVTYEIVPEESTASYIAEEEFFEDALSKYGIAVGDQDTVGSTSAIEGEFTLNWTNLNQQPLGSNSFTVDLSTLESDQPLRDRWIRNNGPEFSANPEANFVASELQGAPDTYTIGETVEFQLVGQLTILDVTQPAIFLVTAQLNDDTITGTATTTATMSNFGIEPPNFANTLTVNDEFQIKVDFTARAQ